MRTKRLRNGDVAYYWAPPRRVERENLPLHAEPLGTDYAAAARRAMMLNAQCYSFRKRKKRTKSMRVPALQQTVPALSSVPESPIPAVTEAAAVTPDAEQMELVA
jgi:hypothetical protein